MLSWCPARFRLPQSLLFLVWRLLLSFLSSPFFLRIQSRSIMLCYFLFHRIYLFVRFPWTMRKGPILSFPWFRRTTTFIFHAIRGASTHRRYPRGRNRTLDQWVRWYPIAPWRHLSTIKPTTWFLNFCSDARFWILTASTAGLPLCSS